MGKPKLVSLTPENLDYVNTRALVFGRDHKFSEALNKIIDEHKKMRSLSDIKNEILSLRHDVQIRETSSGEYEIGA